MVSRLRLPIRCIAALLLFPLSVQAGLEPLLLRWEKPHSDPCRNIVETFFRELRSIAGDQPVELDLAEDNGASPKTISLRCVARGGTKPDTIELERTQPPPGKLSKLSLRYVAAAEGFDGRDWLVLQQQLLRPEPDLSALAPSDHANEGRPLMSQSQMSFQDDQHSIFEEWWFWGIIAGVGVGLYAGLSKLNRASSIGVEIH